MQIHELNQLSRDPQSGDKMVIDTGTQTLQIDYDALARAIVALNAPIPIAQGGTGATDAAGARANLGAVASPVPVAQGGTGATDAATARANLGAVASPVPVAQGGTGATDASGARSAIGAYATSGGVLTGDIIRQGNGWPAIYFRDASGNNLAAIIYAVGSHRFYLRQYTSNGNTRDYRLPSAWSETTGGYYDIDVTQA